MQNFLAVVLCFIGGGGECKLSVLIVKSEVDRQLLLYVDGRIINI